MLVWGGREVAPYFVKKGLTNFYLGLFLSIFASLTNV